ncbi:helix-turn-helix domain-containing protein [Novosphingobium sp. P6W]|uniref:helix-turn-helix domain-containing protein n=1 Tax=Novosphingobium sp. P6W TaxID=1609758 RepID=UPI001F06740F|nr:helix-turn-helix domain-containing protein [Novosphingobium sp. P6W]
MRTSDFKRYASLPTDKPLQPTIEHLRGTANVGPANEFLRTGSARTSHPPSFKAVSVRIPTAAAMLGIGKTKLYELISTGEIDMIKIGKVSLIAVNALEAFVERQRRTNDTPRCRPASRGRPRKSFTELIR